MTPHAGLTNLLQLGDNGWHGLGFRVPDWLFGPLGILLALLVLATLIWAIQADFRSRKRRVQEKANEGRLEAKKDRKSKT